MQCAITGLSSIPSTAEEKKNIKKGKGNRKGNVKGSRKMKMEKEQRTLKAQRGFLFLIYDNKDDFTDNQYEYM